MAGSEWIGSYLDAILESKAGTDDMSRTATAIAADKEALTAAIYFVNEATSDDAALYRTWIRVQCSQDHTSIGESERMRGTLMYTPLCVHSFRGGPVEEK